MLPREGLTFFLYLSPHFLLQKRLSGGGLSNVWPHCAQGRGGLSLAVRDHGVAAGAASASPLSLCPWLASFSVWLEELLSDGLSGRTSTPLRGPGVRGSSGDAVGRR